MDEVRDFIEYLGRMTNSNDFVNGLVLTGAVAATTLLGTYRLLRGKKKDTDRIKANIDAPAGTRISFESGKDNEGEQ